MGVSRDKLAAADDETAPWNEEMPGRRLDNPEHPQKKPAASSVQKDDHQRQRALETGDVMGVPKPGQQATVAKSRNSLPGGMHAAVKIPTKSQRSGKVAVAQQAPSSKFRGVTRHRRSGRWEANIWVGKGVNKQIYLGGYEREELAAEAYDVAALKFKGLTAATNYSKERYKELRERINSYSVEELVAAVKRGSQAFARGQSSYRGVSRKFEARLGIAGTKHMYLGLYQGKEAAAKAYDQAAVRLKGAQAATNFNISEYARQVTEYELKQLETKRPAVFHALLSHALTVQTLRQLNERAVGTKQPAPTAGDQLLCAAAAAPCSTGPQRQPLNERCSAAMTAATQKYVTVATRSVDTLAQERAKMSMMLPPLPSREHVTISDTKSPPWSELEGMAQWIKTGYPDAKYYALACVLASAKGGEHEQATCGTSQHNARPKNIAMERIDSLASSKKFLTEACGERASSAAQMNDASVVQHPGSSGTAADFRAGSSSAAVASSGQKVATAKPAPLTAHSTLTDVLAQSATSLTTLLQNPFCLDPPAAAVGAPNAASGLQLPRLSSSHAAYTGHSLAAASTCYASSVLPSLPCCVPTSKAPVVHTLPPLHTLRPSHTLPPVPFINETSSNHTSLHFSCSQLPIHSDNRLRAQSVAPKVRKPPLPRRRTRKSHSLAMSPVHKANSSQALSSDLFSRKPTASLLVRQSVPEPSTAAAGKAGVQSKSPTLNQFVSNIHSSIEYPIDSFAKHAAAEANSTHTSLIHKNKVFDNALGNVMKHNAWSLPAQSKSPVQPPQPISNQQQHSATAFEPLPILSAGPDNVPQVNETKSGLPSSTPCDVREQNNEAWEFDGNLLPCPKSAFEPVTPKAKLPTMPTATNHMRGVLSMPLHPCPDDVCLISPPHVPPATARRTPPQLYGDDSLHYPSPYSALAPTSGGILASTTSRTPRWAPSNHISQRAQHQLMNHSSMMHPHLYYMLPALPLLQNIHVPQACNVMWQQPQIPTPVFIPAVCPTDHNNVHVWPPVSMPSASQ